MMRWLRHNLALKVFSLIAAIMIWAYAVSERAANPTRQVIAEVVVVGEPPRGLDVEVRSTTVPVEVTGPRAQLEAIPDGSVKAIVDLSTARPGSRALRVIRFVAPPEAPAISFPPQTRTVEAIVHSTVRKRVRISADVASEPPPGKRYSSPRIEPGWADVEGPQEAVEKVALLMVRPDVKSSGFRGQVVVDPVDRQGMTVAGVRVDPPNVHVEVDVQDLLESKSLVVSPTLEGHPTPPYIVASVTCDPAQVTVTGMPRDIAGLDSIKTAPITLDGIHADTVREVALQMPAGVTLRENRMTVQVTIRVKDASKPEQ